jgi:uncharacterized protein YraI
MPEKRLTRRKALALGARAATIGAIAPVFLAQSSHAAERQETSIGGSLIEYFPETGHNVQRTFLDIFERLGGKEIVGLPLSEERFVEGAGVVQTFEGFSLVYDPTLESPWDMQGEHLPQAIKQGFAPSSARRAVSGCSGEVCTFFPETSHSINGAIAEFWSSGGLALFGMPLSEPYADITAGSTLQVFERVVLEDRGGREGVRLYPIARQLAEEAGSLTAELAFLPAPPTGGETRLVTSPEGLRLRGGPGTTYDVIVLLADNAEFVMAPGASGAWLPGYADGYSGWVSSEFVREPEKLPSISEADWDLTVWQGAALSEVNVRAQPTTTAPAARMLQFGDPVRVTAWVEGEEVYDGADLWAQIGPSEYVYGRNVGRNAPVMPTPIPPDAPRTGKWIDVNLTQQLMMAYEGRTVVRTCLVTTGMAGWETPTGNFTIINRVANETMDSGAIGAESFYKLEDVLFTQYFTNQGHAIHFAWWRTAETIGRPGSHGCLNLMLDDSQFYWDWADYGVPLIIHY